MTYAAEVALVTEAIVGHFAEYVGIGDGCNDITEDEIRDSALKAADAALAAIDEARMREQAAYPVIPEGYTLREILHL